MMALMNLSRFTIQKMTINLLNGDFYDENPNFLE